MAFEGKVVVVTGAAAGIGADVAVHLASKGARVSISDVADMTETAKKVMSYAKEGESDLLVCKLDVRDGEAVEDWHKQTVQKFGRLDGAVNAAGTVGKYHALRPLGEQDWDDWDLIVDVNLKGLARCMKAQINAMLKSGGGSIVNIASQNALVGATNTAPYTASKHAVHGLTKTATLEYAAQGIRVNSIAPGGIDTAMMWECIERRGGKEFMKQVQSSALIPMGRTAVPREISTVVAFLLSDDSSYVTGDILTVDGGWTAQ